MILIYPPAAKLSEPPAGIARLAGALRTHEVSVHTVDMNLEGFRYLFNSEISADDRWSTRAIKRRNTNYELLCSEKGYDNPDRYTNAVHDMNRVLKVASAKTSSLASLANYKSDDYSPVKSSDLTRAAEYHESNLYFPYFKKKFQELDIQTGGLTTVGFSLNFLNQALCTFAMIGYLRKNFSHVKIVLGGGLVTSWMRKPGWVNPFGNLVDLMISGEGESQLLDLHGVSPSEKSYMPDYSDFYSNRYLSPGLILPYSSSSGCYWRKCTFCPEKAEKNPYLPIACDEAARQLKNLSEQYRPSLIHIVDNAVSPAFLKSLVSKELRTPWYAFARVTKQLSDINFCKELRKSGCRMLKLGIESGDEKVLAQMNKGVNLKLVSQVLKTLKEAGIKTYIYLLFGTPSENEKAARKTMEFTLEHIDQISFLNLAVFNLPWFAPESASLDTGLFYEGDLSLYREFSHPLGWSRGKIRSFLGKEFKKNPEISEVIKRDPPIFNSNHAAFF